VLLEQQVVAQQEKLAVTAKLVVHLAVIAMVVIVVL
jgi:hypothetical protein